MNEKIVDYEKITGIVALLVHAAKIDENYTVNERKIIISFIKNFLKDEEEINKILKKGEELESNSNQLLNFTDKIIHKLFYI